MEGCASCAILFAAGRLTREYIFLGGQPPRTTGINYPRGTAERSTVDKSPVHPQSTDRHDNHYIMVSHSQ